MTNHKSRSLSRKTLTAQLSVAGDQNCGLTLPVDYSAPLRGTEAHSVLDKRTAGTQAILDSTVPNANLELAALLRDVNKKFDGMVTEGDQGKTWQELLRRAVRCATRQYSLQAELGSIALTDDLTGLYNRRGFLLLAERQLKLARRAHRGLLLFFMDLDGLKRINDSFGHAEGDRALRIAASALRETFRDSDVLARFGGDEFAALAVEASDWSEKTIRNRLYRHIRALPAESGQQIFLSLGAARFDSRTDASLQELLETADHAMYDAKRRDSSARSQFRAAATN